MEIKINLNETVKFKLTDYGKDVYYHQFDDLNERIIKNGGKPIKPHFPKEDENGYCEMQLWGLMDLYGNYMTLEHQDVFKPFQIIYECELKENDIKNEIKSEAIKEFAGTVRRYIKSYCNPYGKPTLDYDTSVKIMHFIDNLVKEMMEVETNQRKEDEGK